MRHRPPATPAFACLLVVLAATGVDAAVVDQRPLQVGQVVYLRIAAGDVRLEPGAAGTVGVEADLAPGQALRWRDTPGRLVLVVDDGERLRPREARVVVAVPADSGLVLELGDAGLDLAGVGGRRLVVRGGRGDVRVESPSNVVDVETVGGNIDVRQATGRLRVRSVTGMIEVQAGGAMDIDADTVAGRLALATAGGGNVRASSVSGPIDARFGSTAGLRAQLETLSGGIDVRVPPGQGLTLELTQASGEVEMPAVFAQRPDGRFVQGSGGGELRLDSFSGALRVRVLPAAEPVQGNVPSSSSGRL